VLLALQTTAEGLDDGTLDALTLVLLVGFVVSMVVLSFLLARRGGETTEERDPPRETERPVEPSPSPPLITRIEPRTVTATDPSTPAWLTGVTFPRSFQTLSDAAAVVERLLEARRTRDLAAGIALYSPAFRERMAAALGVTEDGLFLALDETTIEGDPPALRSIELVSATGDDLRVRAGYADRSTELYRLVRIDGQWAIDSIERA
jgi:hypothetical protein